MDWTDYPFAPNGPGISVRHHRSVPEQIPLHRHKFYELVLVLSGSGFHCTEDGEYPISAGDLFLIPPGSPHGYRNRHAMALYNLVYLPDRMPIDLQTLHDEPGYRAFFETAPREYRQKFQFPPEHKTP